ncbi:hypothetical protein BB559_002371 [Furculomyces boomerangus]|uniref:Trm112p-like protein n=2 Tax=Harpellales TaxID=61421 RepID=A0A2T9YVZ0_9FUNG|nr:hypothetical protein BB559_002371 [Furculomyces boomerangus]PVZ99144.1 hypothetical protein BB558_004835 [Smittium angustum]PWA00444.1 hypothetical protein BB558_003482 [Smittium angustum]
MRLITHNMLKCHVRGCDDSSKNFPLEIQDAQLEQIEAEKNDAFLVRMFPRLEWNALVSTAKNLSINNLPEKIPENIEEDQALLEILHTVLLETNVKEGRMVCRGCGHIYAIKNSVPNMLLAEHEI